MSGVTFIQSKLIKTDYAEWMHRRASECYNLHCTLSKLVEESRLNYRQFNLRENVYFVVISLSENFLSQSEPSKKGSESI